MKLKLFLALAVLSLSLFGEGDQTKKTNEITGLMDEMAGKFLAKENYHALSIGLYVQEKTYIKCYGSLEPGGQRLPTENTLYEIASLTKTFTGVLLANAIHEGRLKLEDDVRTYLPYDLPNLAYGGAPINFRHIVTHTSGLPRMLPDRSDLFENPDFDVLPWQLNEVLEGFSRDDFFEELRKVRLVAAPGTQPGYSNAAAKLLGYCLEHIYGASYEQLLQRYILGPLGMTATQIRLLEAATPELAPGFNHNGVEMPHYITEATGAAGALKSTPVDMMRYLQFHLRTEDPIIRISHQELLEGKYGDFENGLFWQINKAGDKPDRIFQNGGAYGTSCWMTLVPEKQIGIFVITNTAAPETHHYLQTEVVEPLLMAL